MVNKVDYIFKVDSLKRPYALRVDLTTGKKTRVPVKVAKKRASNLKSARKKAVIIEKIKATESGATYEDYKEMLPVIEAEVLARRKKEGLKPLSAGAMRGKVKTIAIDHRTGIATRMRYAWVYRIVIEREITDEGEILVECDTSIFKARGLKRNGDHFTRMSSICQDVYDKINSLDLCSIDGGACVVMYDKSNKEVIKQFELGKGCGFSFDFKNYDQDDTQNEYQEGAYDWI